MLPYLPPSFRLPPPTLRTSRFFPTLHPRPWGLLSGLLSPADMWPLCTSAQSTFPSEPRGVPVPSRGWWDCGVTICRWERCAGQGQGLEWAPCLLLRTSAARHTVGVQTRQSTWELISCAPPYMPLCQEVHTLRERGIMHFIIFYILIVQSSIVVIHMASQIAPRGLQTSAATWSGPRCHAWGFLSCQVLIYRMDLMLFLKKSFSFLVFQRN